jgi:hypothetical protein
MSQSRKSNRNSEESKSIELQFSHGNKQIPRVSATAKNSRFHNRTILVNRNLRKDKCSIFWINTHGCLLAKINEKKKWVCNSKPSPFNVMFRFIDAAPGEINISSDNNNDVELYYNNPIFKNPDLTADMLATNLTQIGRTNFDDINKISTLYIGVQKRFTNIGRDKRYHKLINYQDSPYCLKTLTYDGSWCKDNDQTSGVIQMEPNGKKTNLFFKKHFMTFCSDFDPDQHEWSPGKSRSGKKIVASVTNELLFFYVVFSLKIKNAFFIDSSCDYLEQLSLGDDPSVSDAIEFLTRGDFESKLEMDQYDLGMQMNALKAEGKDVKKELEEYEQLKEELQFLYDSKDDTSKLVLDYKTTVSKIEELENKKEDPDSQKKLKALKTYLRKTDNFIRDKMEELPIVQDLMEFQASVKQNSQHWNVVQKGYQRFR